MQCNIVSTSFAIINVSFMQEPNFIWNISLFKKNAEACQTINRPRENFPDRCFDDDVYMHTKYHYAIALRL